MRLNKIGVLFVSLNVLNILDKILTYFVLKNPNIGELNPIVRYTIERFGVTQAMLLYILIGFVIFCVAYKIVVYKRLFFEKHYMPPETLFMMLNVAFCIVVINNIFWLLK